MVLDEGVIMWQTLLLVKQTHQYNHSLQSHRFLGHTGHSADPSRWVYNDTDLPPYHTRHWGSPEGRTDMLGTTDTDKRWQGKYQPFKNEKKPLNPHHNPVFICILTQSTIMNDGWNTADEFGAHLSQGRHRCHHERIQTHVTNHLLPPLLCLWLISLETRKLRVFGDQNQLLEKKKSYTAAMAIGVTAAKSCNSDFEISKGENNSTSRDF